MPIELRGASDNLFYPRIWQAGELFAENNRLDIEGFISFRGMKKITGIILVRPWIVL